MSDEQRPDRDLHGVAWRMRMLGIQRVYPHMTPAERAELEAWERDNLDGHSVGSSDWPGWRRVIARVGPDEDGQ